MRLNFTTLSFFWSTPISSHLPGQCFLGTRASALCNRTFTEQCYSLFVSGFSGHLSQKEINVAMQAKKRYHLLSILENANSNQNRSRNQNENESSQNICEYIRTTAHFECGAVQKLESQVDKRGETASKIPTRKSANVGSAAWTTANVCKSCLLRKNKMSNSSTCTCVYFEKSASM